MLLRFAVENFSSMRDRQELSLVATSLKGNEGILIPTDAVPGGTVLPGVFVYGANASGKSNLVAALSFMRQAVLHSHARGTPETKIPREVFALEKSSSEKLSYFSVDFLQSGTRYHFGFEANDSEFVNEWLYAFPAGRRQMLYERSAGSKISFGRSLRGRNRVVADLMRPNSLFISAARQNNHEEISQICSFFAGIRFANSIFVAGEEVSRRFSNSDTIDKRAISFLGKIHTGVKGYRNIEREHDAKTMEMMKALFSTIRNFAPEPSDISDDLITKSNAIELLHEGEAGNDVFFNIDKESSGTRRLLILMSAVFKSIDEGGVIVVDEIDASLHTQVCELITAHFFDRDLNHRNAQLIATTHDTNLMRSSLLRRDQIWFSEKDEAGATSIYPLSDIQTRQSDNIEKGYLQGRYGAIPFAGSVLNLVKGPH